MPDSCSPCASSLEPVHPAGGSCPYCHCHRHESHAHNCPARRRAALSVRLSVPEYDALCLRAIREERTVTDLIRCAVKIILRKQQAQQIQQGTPSA